MENKYREEKIMVAVGLGVVAAVVAIAFVAPGVAATIFIVGYVATAYFGFMDALA